MALYVNTNVSALNGQRNLAEVTSRLNTSFERLSSGSRINSAKDDAAGLQISNRLTTQITGLNQSTRNANDGISIAQIAEGALGEVTTNIQRMRQLVVQNGNNTLSDNDRNALAQEFKKLLYVNQDIADRTAFGERKLLDGSAPETGFTIQSGAYAGQRDTVTTGNATLKGLLQGVSEDDSTITASTALISDMTNANTSLYGVVGDLVAAYAALDSTANVSTVVESLFGLTAGHSIALHELSSSLVTIDIEELTKLVTQEEIANGAGTYATVASLQLAATGFGNEILSAFQVASLTTVDSITGFSEAQLQIIRDYTHDSMMGAMSDLISRVDSIRATLGAEQNGLNSIVRANQVAITNVSDSRSRITDTDFAAETAELTRNQIIQQASNTILAQANQLPQAALSLLG